MAKVAIIRTGGKQFLVRENDVLYVNKLDSKIDDKIELETLGVFAEDSDDLELGAPVLKTSVNAQVVEHLKGDKVRVSKFKAKVRYRRTNGFRAELTKIKILSI